jgi:hypothetical protein
LITRETVPMPTPDAAATSPIVARRDPDIPAPAVRWNRFHTNEIIVAPVANPRQGPNFGYDRVAEMPANQRYMRVLLDDL